MRSPEELLNGREILIVDDDARNIFALSSYLDSIGIKIYSVENGYEAIDFLKDGHGVDVVLMDMMMPELDGYEAIGKIREDKAIAYVPIIAVTAKAMKSDREKCLEAGADEYVSKPVNLQELLQKMSVLISVRK